MYTPVNKSKENSSPTTMQENRAVANSVSYTNSCVAKNYDIVDNRQNISVFKIIQKRKRNFDLVVLPILQKHWQRLSDEGISKWKEDDSIAGEGEGACSAKVISSDKRVEGKFKGSVHAEINALAEVGFTGVEQIRLSSAPCPRCAVVLEASGLSSFVRYRPSPSRMGPTWGWPEDLTVLMSLICPPEITVEERVGYQDKIYSAFTAGAWK